MASTSKVKYSNEDLIKIRDEVFSYLTECEEKVAGIRVKDLVGKGMPVKDSVEDKLTLLRKAKDHLIHYLTTPDNKVSHYLDFRHKVLSIVSKISNETLYIQFYLPSLSKTPEIIGLFSLEAAAKEFSKDLIIRHGYMPLVESQEDSNHT